ncbi:alpha/beta hydrolase [Chitinophaga arvensicola]|uniref:Acetyl esterase/lipase n=1 Tax=Chitinophaga arvensicola TaxID=29529 RepID=A0A1I0S6A9_9BACT|nr:alpha/beta hydrolase [Chitinophaga arvensicola]SEW51003.1 Acetyl esterase/lipase [Chitinophaga arvensicola]
MRSLLISLFSFVAFAANAQTVMPLYTGLPPGGIAGPDEEITDKENNRALTSVPTLTAYLPSKEKATGTAVLICPGGAYTWVVLQKEGLDIAAYFQQQGIAAFVLKYRLPDDKIMQDKSSGPLQDAQEAMKIIRSRATEWNIDTKRVGIMGFSAGGHLASTVGTHFDRPVLAANAGLNLRPDFMILVYPVISMEKNLTHPGSRQRLLGNQPDELRIKNYSNDRQVTPQTPPTILFHTGDDTVVDVDNSFLFYQALRHQHVPAEMHIYPEGNHGFVLKLPVEVWMQTTLKWMGRMGMLNPGNPLLQGGTGQLY